VYILLEKIGVLFSVIFPPFTIMLLFFMSCDSNKDPIVDPEPTVAPATYNFNRNGTTSVSYTGQSTRIAMGQEFISALKDETKTEIQLDAMFNHQEGDSDFSDANLNSSSKNIRSKTAASTDLFSANTTDATAIKNQFDSWIAEQVSDVFPNWSVDASAGVAGKIQEAGGGSTRYVDGKGLELNQAIKVILAAKSS